MIKKYGRLKTAFTPYGDVFLLRQKDDQLCEYINERNLEVNEVLFSIEDLAQLPYKAIESSIIPGSNHFILLWFFNKYPGYSHYWNIEYDVNYTGDWASLFDAFSESDSDFLSSHIRPFMREPEWYWWSTLFTGNNRIPLNKRVASFNPIYRLTARATAFLHEKLSMGWAGHHEVFIPTLLKNSGFKIEDFGGTGDYVRHCNINKFYNAENPPPFGTMRHAPPFCAETILQNNLLYHPIKI